MKFIKVIKSDFESDINQDIDKAQKMQDLIDHNKNDKHVRLAFWNWYWNTFDYDKEQMILEIANNWENGFNNPVNVEALRYILNGLWGNLIQLCMDKIGGEFWFEADGNEQALAEMYDEYTKIIKSIQ